MKFLKVLLIIFLVLTVAFAVDFLTGYSVHSDEKYGDKDVNTMDFYLPCDLDECEVKYDFIFLPGSDHSLLQNPLEHLRYYLLLLEYCETYF